MITGDDCHRPKCHRALSLCSVCTTSRTLSCSNRISSLGLRFSVCMCMMCFMMMKKGKKGMFAHSLALSPLPSPSCTNMFITEDALSVRKSETVCLSGWLAVFVFAYTCRASPPPPRMVSFHICLFAVVLPSLTNICRCTLLSFHFLSTREDTRSH